MAFNVLDLLREDGLDPQQVTPEPEHQGACPGCGGSDRFCVWPEQNRREGEGQARGSYHCGHGHGGNGCGKAGDNIQYLRDFRGMSYKDAVAYLGLSGPDRQPARPASRAFRAPAQTTAPEKLFTPTGGEHPPDVLEPAIWQAQAEKFVVRCHQELLANEKNMAYLAGRGITRESIIRHRLGLHKGKVRKGVAAEPDYRPLTSWGIKNKPRPNGQPGAFVIPAGIVIPWADDRGLHTVQLRLFKPDPKTPKKKYHFVKGSAIRTLVLRPEAPVQMPIETVLDAILVDQIAGDLVGAIALGASGYHPSPAAHQVLARSALILQALDYDQAGATVRAWWESTYSHSRRWPTPSAKDPGEAWQQGVDLRSWIIAGLPPGLRPSSAVPPPPVQVEPPLPTVPCPADPRQITLPDGQPLWLTTNPRYVGGSHRRRRAGLFGQRNQAPPSPDRLGPSRPGSSAHCGCGHRRQTVIRWLSSINQNPGGNTMIDLKQFCSQDGSHAINTPWSEGGYTYASNGHLLVRVPRIVDIPEKIEAPSIDGTSIGAGFDKKIEEWFDVPTLVIDPDDCPECKGTGKQYNCPECEGEGEVHLSTDWSDYGEETCETCGGNGQLSREHWLRLMPKGSSPAGENCYSCGGIGKKYEGKTVEIGGGLYTDTLLAQIATLPKCVIGVPDKQSPAVFRFDGGDGLLMPRLSE